MPAGVELYAFCTDPGVVWMLVVAGVDGFVIDWEHRGKERRQSDWDTQINTDTPDDLRVIRDAVDVPVLCRVDGAGNRLGEQVTLARRLGADEVLVPMVRGEPEVEAALDIARDSVGVGILVETNEAVSSADTLAKLPLARVFVGLNDLAIARGTTSLFRPMVDGTVEHLRQTFPVPFGVAGLTHPARGAPVPCDLVVAALVALRADFTFLRRSFFADLRDYCADTIVDAIGEAVRRERALDPASQRARLRELSHCIDALDRAGAPVLGSRS